MNFQFKTAGHILFGPGVMKKIGPLVATLGRRALVVSNRPLEVVEPLLQLLELEASVVLQVSGEPSVEVARAGVRKAHEAGCDLVVGFGGGSAIDAGKAIAALSANPGDVLDYLEVIGGSQSLVNQPLPFIAIPTTAGTGSEVTCNAVICSPRHRVKVSLRSSLMLPRLAVIDPESTMTLPPDITASTGLDALTQVIEPYTCNVPNSLIDPLCEEGIRRAACSLLKACENGCDIHAREDMSLVSLFGGLALANARLGAVHGIAGPLGGMFPAPHSAVCAALLPHVMVANIAALSSRTSGNPALQRYEKIARIITSDPDAHAQDGAVWISNLCIKLNIPPLSAWGVCSADLPELVEKSARSSSMKGNPIPLMDKELNDLLERAL